MTKQVHEGDLDNAGTKGVLAGSAMCSIALLRICLCWWEVYRGTLEERLIDTTSVPGEGVYEDFDEMPAEEIQLQNVQKPIQVTSPPSSPTSVQSPASPPAP